MVAPNPLAARRRTKSSSFSVAVPSSWEESVVSGAIANRFAISRPQLNLKADQTTIDRTSTHKLSKTSALMDDAATPQGLHDRGYRLGQAHRPRQVDGHDLVPDFQRQIVEIAEGDRNVVGGVIDQNVEAAESLGYLADQPIHSRAVGYVTGEG